jgi:NAD(P)-dependent dehydrogenase (short-subunit alcohol dehydrogenase family)
MNRLQGKTAIITGGNSGVGAATAKLLAAEGANVVITARRAAALEEVAGEIKAAGGNVLAVPTDISNEDAVENMVSETLKAFGKVDILVNNAGILEEGLKPIDRYSDADLDRIVETNTKGTMRCMRAVLPKMEKGASVVNVASVAGVIGNGGAAYVASKAAIVGITRHTALRFQAQGIRCNVVCPGTIVTPMTASMKADELDQDLMGAMAAHSNMRTQPCMAEDVANIILFLASDESRAITGQTIVSDFGSTL